MAAAAVAARLVVWCWGALSLSNWVSGPARSLVASGAAEATSQHSAIRFTSWFALLFMGYNTTTTAAWCVR